LKKSNQKTFAPAGFGAGVAKARRSESFLLLFFKKEALAFTLYCRTSAAPRCREDFINKFVTFSS
jgi:hypothetical protein